MAHYAQKIRIKDADKQARIIQHAGGTVLYSTCETDSYYKEITPGQFQRLRRYDPPIPYNAHDVTGEAVPSVSANVTHKTPADFILIHAQHSTHDLVKSDIGVLRCTSPAQADHIDDVMRLNRPFDMEITKKRTAYWLDIEGVSVRVHIDRDVIDQSGKSHGSFVEFECKYQDALGLSEARALNTIEKAKMMMGVEGHDIIDTSYYDVVKSHYMPKNSLLRHLPFVAALDILCAPSFFMPHGGRLITQYDQKTRDGFYLESGQVAVSYGAGHHIRNIGSCDVVGEMAIETGIRTANVDAVGDVLYKKIPASIVASFAQEAPLMNHFITRMRDDEVTRSKIRRGLRPF